jgi:hypothetical protein
MKTPFYLGVVPRAVVCTCLHTYAYTCMYVCTYVHTYVCMHACIYIYIHVHVHLYIDIEECIGVCVCARVCVCVCVEESRRLSMMASRRAQWFVIPPPPPAHIRTSTHTHAHAYTRIHIHTHAHTHTRTHAGEASACCSMLSIIFSGSGPPTDCEYTSDIGDFISRADFRVLEAGAGRVRDGREGISLEMVRS